ncbi:MAG: 4Fe-4S binding protein, partial [Clostridia bacterium]|nr:4Fe-4S binding protein [Clostridia bacterium]
MAHKIDQKKCISCGTCDMECPFGAIIISDQGKFSIDEEKCTDCDKCAKACPVDAA